MFGHLSAELVNNLSRVFLFFSELYIQMKLWHAGYEKAEQNKSRRNRTHLSSGREITAPAECWRQIHTQASPPTVLERELGQSPPKKECSAAAEERDNFHRDAHMNDRNHASGAPRPGCE